MSRGTTVLYLLAMFSSEIPYHTDKNKGDFSLSELINRVQPPLRANWKDIYKDAGLYVVYHTNPNSIKFNDNVGKSNAQLEESKKLEEKWEGIIKHNGTDIVYIGKGNVRSRTRNLIHFGLGKAINHKGGEWLWQIEGSHNLRIVVTSCPDGKQAAYEKYLLDKFRDEHGNWPLANREGGKGKELWMPLMDTL